MGERGSQQTEAIMIIDNQLSSLSNLKSPLSENIPMWKSRTSRFLEHIIRPEEIAAFNDISKDNWPKEAEALKDFLMDLRQGIETIPNKFLLPLANNTIKQMSKKSKTNSHKKDRTDPQVFIIHGHNDT